MSLLREIPPTAGWPVYFKDILSLFSPIIYKGSLEDDFKKYLGLDYARLTYSGTSAFYIILESLKKISRKKTVVIPSYICPLIPLAIARAGLKVAVCDIEKENFNFNPDKLMQLCLGNTDILAVVPTHLAGIPVDFDSVAQIVRNHGIFTIEDCAQSLGAEYKGKKVGSLGDFSFFSLCRGKGMTIYEGGVIATKHKNYSDIIEKTIDEFIKKDFFSEAMKIFELFGYAFFYRPQLFWFVFRMPEVYWNLRGQKFRALIEDFSIDFPMHRVSGIRKTIGYISFKRLNAHIGAQREKAKEYFKELEGIKGVKAVMEPDYGRASYPYLTLLFEDRAARDKAREKLYRLGLGVSAIYASAAPDYPYLKGIVPSGDFPSGRLMAERELTLSTSIFLKNRDIKKIAGILKEL